MYKTSPLEDKPEEELKIAISTGPSSVPSWSNFLAITDTLWCQHLTHINNGLQGQSKLFYLQVHKNQMVSCFHLGA